MAEFQAIGATAARAGRTLDGAAGRAAPGRAGGLALAVRGWRRALDRRELSQVGEAVFCVPGRPGRRLRPAATRRPASQAAGDRQRRLLAAILADPPPHAELVASLARGGRLGPARPDSCGGLSASARGPGRDASRCRPACSPTGPAPSRACSCRTPTGRAAGAALDRALRGHPAVIGPSVPLARAAKSLRWARHARTLAHPAPCRASSPDPPTSPGPPWSAATSTCPRC